MEAEKTQYTYEEREAIQTIRKAMLKKPQIIELIMKDTSRAMAQRVLLKARDELGQLLEVNRAFVAAASTLVKAEKQEKEN